MTTAAAEEAARRIAQQIADGWETFTVTRDDAQALLSSSERARKLEEALRDIRDATDPDAEASYRADDREGCLDAVFALAREALSPSPEGGAGGKG